LECLGEREIPVDTIREKIDGIPKNMNSTS
jgi:hypothetical protein